MPYEIRVRKGRHCVYKKGAGGKALGCHPSRSKAVMQMRALYAAESVPAKGREDVDVLLVEQRATELMPAIEAVWSDNADGLPQADIVIIRPGESANRRFYSKEAIADAVARDFWGGTPMFVDHATESRMPRKRSFRDFVARIEKGTSYIGQEGEARARTTFIDPDFAAKVRNAGPSAGLSAVHEFMGQRYRGSDGHYHERVDKFVVNHSVDFVAFPAAGGGVAQFLPAMESESEDDVEWKDLDEEMLRKHRPDLVEALAAESDEQPDDDGDDKDDDEQPDEQPAPEGVISLAAAKRFAQEAAQHVVEEYEQKQRKQADARTKISAHVERSGLPEKTRKRILTAFEGQDEYNADAVQGAIDEAAAEARELGWRGPVVRNLGSSSAAEGDEKPLSADEKAKIMPTAMAFESQMEYVPSTGKATAN